MEFSFESILGFIKANFFYDFRASIITICVLVLVLYFFKLLKYDNEKPVKSLKYITVILVCCAVVAIIY